VSPQVDADDEDLPVAEWIIRIYEIFLNVEFTNLLDLPRQAEAAPGQ
jgi:hypothetical protein